MNEIKTNEQFKTAVELHQKIIITAQAAQQNLFDMCVLLKQMRDEKLYKELGYQNFEDYCENEVGFSRMNAHRYISIIENIKNVTSMLHCGTTKLSLLASLSESQQEEIQETVNLEETSVRKLKEEIARIRGEKEQSESALTEQIRAESGRAERERHRAEKAEDDLTQAQKRIKELEHRPIDVPIVDAGTQEENEKLKAKLHDAEKKLREIENSNTDLRDARAMVRQLDRQLSEADQEHANNLEIQRKKYQAEINRLNELLESQKSTVRTAETISVPDMKEVFKAYYKNAIDAFNTMLEFIRHLDSDKDFCVKKAGQLVGKLYDSLENMED